LNWGAVDWWNYFHVEALTLAIALKASIAQALIRVREARLDLLEHTEISWVQGRNFPQKMPLGKTQQRGICVASMGLLFLPCLELPRLDETPLRIFNLPAPP
jgi:hypothetical protein